MEWMFSRETDRLLGELIGLARATDGNEYLIDDALNKTVLECLASARTPDLELWYARLTAEKRRMVPACFTCAAPCGRNNACDLQTLVADIPAKKRLLEALILLGKNGQGAGKEKTVCQSLIAVGIEGIDRTILEDLYKQLDS